MSINKYTLGTIVGAALLGLAKSKIGGRNEGTPLIVPLGHYVRNNNIILKENDINSNPELMGITELPVFGKLSFTVTCSDGRPGESIDNQIAELEEQLKTYYFEENDALDDDDENKQDWESSDDVPDYWFEDQVYENRQELLEQHYEEINGLLCHFVSDLQDQIGEKLYEDPDENFLFLQKVKRSRPIYVYIEPVESFYEEMYEGSDLITLIAKFQIYINSENSLVTLAFINGFEDLLDNLEDFNPDFEDVSVMRVEDKWISQPKSNVPKLRKR